MRSFRRILASTICGLLLSVSAYAVPIDVLSYDVTAPVAITECDRDDTVMTHNDFVATSPYVVTLDVATHIPIDFDAAVDRAIEQAVRETDYKLRNHAIMRNSNFERRPG